MGSSQLKSLPVCLWKKAWCERIYMSTPVGDIYSSEVSFSLAVVSVADAIEVEIELGPQKSCFCLQGAQRFTVESNGFAVEVSFKEIQLSDSCLKAQAIVKLGAGVKGIIWGDKAVFNGRICCPDAQISSPNFSLEGSGS